MGSADSHPGSGPPCAESRILCAESGQPSRPSTTRGRSRKGPMSLSSTSTVAGRGSTRVATAVAVAVAVLLPLALLFAQVWSSTHSARSFSADERRGVAYLGPLTRLLSATTEAQSAAVRGQTVDAASVRAAVAAVDQADARLGRTLRTTD